MEPLGSLYPLNVSSSVSICGTPGNRGISASRNAEMTENEMKPTDWRYIPPSDRFHAYGCNQRQLVLHIIKRREFSVRYNLVNLLLCPFEYVRVIQQCDDTPSHAGRHLPKNDQERTRVGSPPPQKKRLTVSDPAAYIDAAVPLIRYSCHATSSFSSILA
jgi:hypothetical protein